MVRAHFEVTLDTANKERTPLCYTFRLRDFLKVSLPWNSGSQQRVPKRPFTPSSTPLPYHLSDVISPVLGNKPMQNRSAPPRMIPDAVQSHPPVAIERVQPHTVSGRHSTNSALS